MDYDNIPNDQTMHPQLGSIFSGTSAPPKPSETQPNEVTQTKINKVVVSREEFNNHVSRYRIFLGTLISKQDLQSIKVFFNSQWAKDLDSLFYSDQDSVPLCKQSAFITLLNTELSFSRNDKKPNINDSQKDSNKHHETVNEVALLVNFLCHELNCKKPNTMHHSSLDQKLVAELLDQIMDIDGVEWNKPYTQKNAYTPLIFLSVAAAIDEISHRPGDHLLKKLVSIPSVELRDVKDSRGKSLKDILAFQSNVFSEAVLDVIETAISDRQLVVIQENNPNGLTLPDGNITPEEMLRLLHRETGNLDTQHKHAPKL